MKKVLSQFPMDVRLIVSIILNGILEEEKQNPSAPIFLFPETNISLTPNVIEALASTGYRAESDFHECKPVIKIYIPVQK
ncbi:MAG: hypothetical protein WC774_01315 [Candidatus Gracilibacteria bacterium]|jgi:hypothetical protein